MLPSLGLGKSPKILSLPLQSLRAKSVSAHAATPAQPAMHQLCKQRGQMCCAYAAEINDMITNNGKGNPELANLPRKLNIGLSPSRDDFPHTHINDVGLKAVHDPETGEVIT